MTFDCCSLVTPIGLTRYAGSRVLYNSIHVLLAVSELVHTQWHNECLKDVALHALVWWNCKDEKLISAILHMALCSVKCRCRFLLESHILNSWWSTVKNPSNGDFVLKMMITLHPPKTKEKVLVPPIYVWVWFACRCEIGVQSCVIWAVHHYTRRQEACVRVGADNLKNVTKFKATNSKWNLTLGSAKIAV